MVDSTTSANGRLLQRASEGEDHALAELWSLYRPRLRRMIEMRIDKRLAPRVDPSDIVQEAIVAAHERLPDYLANPHMDFYAWLRRIAWDRLSDAYRTHIGAERRSVLRENSLLPGLNADSVAELARSVVAASSCDANQRALRAELDARVIGALGQLKPLDREILVLRYLEQLSVPEIAGVLTLSQTAVTSRHLRALQRLRRLLRDDLRD